jgi:hypothetical protein
VYKFSVDHGFHILRVCETADDHDLVAVFVSKCRADGHNWLVDDFAQILDLRIVVRVLNELLQVLQRLLAVGRAVATLLEEVIAVVRQQLRTDLLSIARTLAICCAYLVYTVCHKIVVTLVKLGLLSTALTLRSVVSSKSNKV